MNAMGYTLNHIKHTIPPEVLHIGFIENFTRVNVIQSIDERIMNSVIRARVLSDASVVSGNPMHIPVNQCGISVMPNNEWIISVPYTLTQNRSIVSVLSLVQTGMLDYTEYQGSQYLQAATKIYNNLSYDTTFGIQTTRLELIGDNTILVYEPSFMIQEAYIKCNVEFNESMSELNPRFYPAFAKLCELGVKAYIYNNCKVKIDQGYVYGGHELNSISDVINDYSSKEEDYQEHLKLIKKIFYMNNGKNMNKHVKSIMGNVF